MPNPVQPPSGSPQNVPADQPSNLQNYNPPEVTWLGMKFVGEDAKNLWQVIMQTVSSAIEKEKQKAVEAIRKMRPENED